MERGCPSPKQSRVIGTSPETPSKLKKKSKFEAVNKSKKPKSLHRLVLRQAKKIFVKTIDKRLDNA
jgi:hypothetical protein